MNIRQHKQRIAGNFSRVADCYSQAADLQYEIGHALVQQLRQLKQQPRLIADIGAGSGLLTDALLALNPQARCYLVDFAYSLLSTAMPDSRVWRICGDFDALPLQNDSVDLLFSSMSLQWSFDLAATLDVLLRCVKAGGLLAIAVPIAGTLAELAATHRINRFYSAADIDGFITQLPVRVLYRAEKKFYKNVVNRIGMLRFLKNTGANYTLPNASTPPQRSVHDATDCVAATQLTFAIYFSIFVRDAI